MSRIPRNKARQWARLVLLLGPALLLPACGGSSNSTGMIDPQTLLDRYDRNRKRHDPATFVEVDLGEYYLTKPKGALGETMIVRFHMYAVVPQSESDQFSDLVEQRRKRMRDGVNLVAQRTDPENLADPALSWMRSELIPMINERLHTQTLRNVVFTQFTLERI